MPNIHATLQITCLRWQSQFCQGNTLVYLFKVPHMRENIHFPVDLETRLYKRTRRLHKRKPLST